MKMPTKIIPAVVILAILVLFPLFVKDPYFQHLANVAFIFAIGIYGFNIITGITGQLNLAHAGFIGIGAYTSAIMATKLGLSFWLAMPAAVLVTASFGVFIGYPSLRLTGVYFALTTLGFGSILALIFDNWIVLTGGPMGVTGIPAPSAIVLPGGYSLSFESKTSFYYLSLVFLAIGFYINRQLLQSRLGRQMLAVSGNETLARSVGISIARTKIIAFVLATILLGVSGSLYAHYFRFISPATFSVGESFRDLTMLVVGGRGTLAGPLIGAVIFTLLPELLRSIEAYQWVAYGLILMVCVIFLPQGIMGFIKEFIAQKRKKVR